MNRKILFYEIAVAMTLSLMLAGCGKSEAKADSGDTAPPPAQVEPDMDASNFKVDHPEQFPVVAAGSHVASTELNATGVVSPDVSRQVGVTSTATGRVIEIKARVGDEVKKDQVLFTVRSNDIAGAFSDYKHAVVAEQLAKNQLTRYKILLDDGAIPKSQLEIAQSTEDAALVDLETSRTRLRVLGSDPDHPTEIVEMHAPISGVITDQQITNASAVQAFATPYPFTISDLSNIWIVCDVFENNLAQVHMDEYADVRLNAYPDRLLKGRISNIGQILDPNLHTAKVRLELPNPGIMRLGMFVTAAFHGDATGNRATVPSSAILHLHDRDFVYTPAPDNHFKRVEVTAGGMLPNNLQEVVGIKPGQQVVSNALVLQSTVEQ
jgi:cobalt-zinc-cadmium efflux system membrane fusion protein